MGEWVRIPAEVPGEEDRRTLAAILASIGLEVRVVKVKLTRNGTVRRFMEYREQGKETEWER